MRTEINAVNIKCGGCSNSITSKLNAMEGVSDTTVDIENGKVSFVAISDQIVDKVRSKLSEMGYPESDSTLFQSAKSYVSCMIGRVKDK